MAGIVISSGNVYQINNLIRVSVQFVDENNVAADPTTVEVYVNSPSFSGVGWEIQKIYGSPSAPEVTRISVGSFRYEFEGDEIGRWTYAWASTDTGEEAYIDSFFDVQRARSRG